MTTANARGTARLYALDVARALAIFGMVIVNVGPYTTDGLASWVIRALNGRASILFVVLAGIGVSFLARRQITKGITRRSALLWRGFLLMVCGLPLQMLDHDVNVILPTYAALFFVAAFAVHLPLQWLFWAAIFSTFLGPVVWILTRQLTDFHIDPAALGDTPLQILSAIVVSGPYPLIVWIAPFFLGIWLGRQPLGNPQVHRRMVIVGGGVGVGAYGLSLILVAIFGHPDQTVVGWDRLVSSFGHSQMPLWVISASGAAVVIIGLMLMLAPHASRSVQPLVAVGQMPLTAYCAHLVIIALFIHPVPDTPALGLALSLAVIVGMVVFATVWMAKLRYGPLEVLLRRPPGLLQVSHRPPERHRIRQYDQSNPRHPKRV